MGKRRHSVEPSQTSEDPRLLRSLLVLLDRKTKIRVALICLISLGMSLLDAVGVLLLVPLIAGLSSSSTASTVPFLGETTVGLLLGLTIGLFLIKTVVGVHIRWWSGRVVAESNARTAASLFDSYMSSSMEFHDERNSASVVNTLSVTLDRVFIRGFLGFLTIVVEGSTVCVLSLAIITSRPLSALVTISYFGLASLFYLRAIQSRVSGATRTWQQSSEASVQTIQEGVGGLREHKVRGTERLLVNRYREQAISKARAERFVVFTGELPRYYLEALFVGGFGIISAITLWRETGSDALEGLALMLGAGFRLLPSVSRLLAAFNSVRSGRTAIAPVMKDFERLYEEPNGPVGCGARVRPEPPMLGGPGITLQPAAVNLEGVSYSYGESDWALRDINLVVPAGSSMGVVGPSGAGKSTLIDLISGVRPPAKGAIRIESQVGHSRVGLVPQDIFLTDNSVSRNVSFGLPEDSERVRMALLRAQALQFVESLPEGFETRIGERGVKLSGGQRQRIGIARALYCEPSVLILDEATAALDVETEAAIVDAVESLSGQLTVIVVAHRLATVRRCAQVAYLNHGTLEAVGSFTEVAKAVPAFRRALVLAGLDGHVEEGRP